MHREIHEFVVGMTHDLSMSQRTRPDVLHPHPNLPLSLSKSFFSFFSGSYDQTQSTND